MSFNEDNFHGQRHFRDDRRRNFTRNAPRPANVVPAMGDSDSSPQVAVGGIKEVTELLTKNPMKVDMIMQFLSRRLRKLTDDYTDACRKLYEAYTD